MSRPDRPHEEGYEDLGWEDFHMLTGLPREAFEEWKTHDPLTRRDIVGIFQEPETLEALREETR